MSLITRFNGAFKAFASEATGTFRTVFGGTTQSNDLTDNLTADFKTGWEIVGTNDEPTIEDFNAMGYTLSQVLAYIHQVGIIEWSGTDGVVGGQDYYAGKSFVGYGGDIYVALLNSGGSIEARVPTNVTYWKKLGDVVNAVLLTGNQTIAGIKTFSSSPIVPNATTATQAMAYGQGVNLTEAQTIAGVKTFSSSPIVPVPTLVNQAISMGNIIEKTGVGIGYGTGSGGTVTQLTSKSTTVTLNKPCGMITMHNASLAAGAIAQFIVSNSLCALGDTVIVNQNTGTPNTQAYQYRCPGVQNGSFILEIKNTTAGALSDAPVICFAIIKGATA